MTKAEAHSIFKNFIVTVRGEKEVVEICKTHDLKYEINSKTEYKRIATRLYIEL